jgi:hypothetical protein
MKDNLLFEVSPIEDEDSKKKKKASKRRSEEPPPKAPPVDYSAGFVGGYIASLDVPCERCGMSTTDLAEVRRNEWLVVCGWGCGRQWAIDPIPGVLEQRKEEKEFVLRDGRFRGKTFDEVWAEGGEWYVRGLVESGMNTIASRAAANWLSKKGH